MFNFLMSPFVQTLGGSRQMFKPFPELLNCGPKGMCGRVLGTERVLYYFMVYIRYAIKHLCSFNSLLLLLFQRNKKGILLLKCLSWSEKENCVLI